MSDENKEILENNQEENQNNTFENKRKQQRNLDFKQKHILNIVLLILIVSIFTCGCKIQTNASLNIEQKNEKAEITLENINTKEMKFSTPEECKQKGLLYIGKMRKKRAFHSIVPIDKNKLLIIGGISKLGVHHYNFGELNKLKETKDIPECNAEIFDIKTLHSTKSYDRLQDYLYKIFKPDENRLILVGKNTMAYDILNRKFTEIKYSFWDEIKNRKKETFVLKENLIICDSYVNTNIPLTCRLTNLQGIEIAQISNSIILKKADQSKFVQLSDDEVLLYRYISSRYGATSDLSFYKYSLKEKKFIDTIEHESVGNIVNIYPINSNIILIASCRRLRGTILTDFILELYDISKREVIKKYDIDKEIETGQMYQFIDNYFEKKIGFMKLNENELLFLGCNYIFNLKTYSLSKLDLLLPVENAEIIVLDDNKIFVSGGFYKGTNNVSDNVYLYKIGE